MATKQQEIREGVAKEIFDWNQRQFNLPRMKWSEVQGAVRGSILSITDIVLEYESCQGVVLKKDKDAHFGMVEVESLIEE